MNRFLTLSTSNFTAILLGVALLAFASQSAEAKPDICYNYEYVNVPDGEVGDKYTSWTGINNQGVIVGNYLINMDWSPTPEGDMVGGVIYDSNHGTFETFTVPAPYDWVGLVSIDERGYVVGTAHILTGWPPSDGAVFVRAPDGTLEFLAEPKPGTLEYASGACTNSGMVVGAYDDPENNDRRTGFILEDDVYTFYDLGPDVERTFIRGVNSRGDLVGNATLPGGDLIGWVDTGSGPDIVTVPDARSTSINGINGPGDYVGTYRMPDPMPYDPGTGFVSLGSGEFQDLNVPDAYDVEAMDINNKGVIVGTTDFFSWGFIATPYNCNKD
jgi:hypothetical protein